MSSTAAVDPREFVRYEVRLEEWNGDKTWLIARVCFSGWSVARKLGGLDVMTRAEAEDELVAYKVEKGIPA